MIFTREKKKIKGVALWNKEQRVILVNTAHKNTLEIIAHEAAHLVCGRKHNEKFNKKWREIYGKLKELKWK